MAQKIDTEVGTLLRTARETAKRIIEFNRVRMNRLVERLLAEESLQGPALEELLGSPAVDAALAA